MEPDPAAVKARSEAILRAAGAEVNEALPVRHPGQPRPQEVVVDRMLALYGLLFLLYAAPEPVEAWLTGNDLMLSVTTEERRILACGSLDGMDEQRIYWSNESMWALGWALGLVEELPLDLRVDESLFEGLPNLPAGESAQAVRERARLRPHDELFAQLDLAYRLGWYTRDSLERRVLCAFNYDASMERLKALEWLLGRESWDDVEVRRP